MTLDVTRKPKMLYWQGFPMVSLDILSSALWDIQTLENSSCTPVRFGDRKVWVARRDLDALIDRSKETFGA
jgi:hypothetical protein